MTQNINLNERKIALVVNGKSNKGRDLFKRAEVLLTDIGVTLVKANCVRKPKEIKNIVKELITQGIDMIIIGGGDGTVSEIVDFGVDKNIIFAILPLGTSNSFARSLQLPLDLNGSIEIIKKSKIKKIDLGKIGNDYFANTANIGISADVNLSVNNSSKKMFGRVAYLPIAIWNLFISKPFKATIKTNSEIRTYKCIEILIANGNFQGGVPIAMEAELDSGNLIFKIFLCNSWLDKLNLIGYWFMSFFKHNIKNRRIVRFRFDEAKIETSLPKTIDVDGESKAKTPINVSVAKDAIWIVTP
jgi:YegS/Rv2252/BmrU family lipid kinase